MINEYQMKNLSKLLLIVFAFNISILICYPAESPVRLVNWKSHSSMHNINSGCIDNRKNFWAATDGGLFKFSLIDSSFTFFRNINELISLELSVVRCNPYNNDIYIGSSDGILEILQNDNEWIHILDIKNAGFSNSRLNDIAFANNRVFIAGAFGVTVFDPEAKVFIEDALNIGNFPPGVSVNKILIDGNNIWLATEAGVAKAELTKSLAQRDVWQTFSTMQGLPATSVIDITIFKDELYCSTDRGIFKLIDDNFERYRDFPVLTLSAHKEELFITTEFFFLSQIRDKYIASFPDKMTGHISYSNDDELFFIVFYQNNGFVIFHNENLKHIKPPTPSSNNIKYLNVDNKGRLWVCSDGTTRGNGFMVYSSDEWINYTPRDFPENGEKLLSAYFINTHPNGNIILSTKGNGLIIARPEGDGYILSVYDESNAPFVGNGFTVVGETVIDNRGTIWLPQFGALSSGPNLLSLDLDDKFRAFENRVVPNQRSFLYQVIDFWGTKWLASDNGYSGGVYYFNDNNTPDILADDLAGLLTTSNSSLVDNNCTSLAIDANGMIWVGTPSGISVIINPSAVLTSSQLVIRKEIRDLRNIFINDIMVDALNNKWVATTNGVYVLDPDGVTIDILTTGNRPLLSNDVKCLATDKNTGRIFFGTRSGISESQSLSIEPEISFNLNCYPQPFEPLIDGELIIEGLEAGSDIRIVTINGKHVRTIKAQGKTTVWDGRDSSGRVVDNGIYLILSTSAKTGNSSYTKIAVVRRK